MRISDWSSDVCSSDLAEHIESFVTKARDQNASKTVVVSAAGFQSGAVLVAERHGVDLFTVTFGESKIRLPSEMTTQLLGTIRLTYQGILSSVCFCCEREAFRRIRHRLHGVPLFRRGVAV